MVFNRCGIRVREKERKNFVWVVVQESLDQFKVINDQTAIEESLIGKRIDVSGGTSVRKISYAIYAGGSGLAADK